MYIELDTLEASIGSENVVTIIDTLLESVPGMCRQLRAAAICRNLRRVMHTAHQLKSDCANVGAMALRERLHLIETRAEAGTLTPWIAVAAAELVSTEVHGLLQALRRARDVRTRQQPTLNFSLIAQGA